MNTNINPKTYTHILFFIFYTITNSMTYIKSDKSFKN